MVLGGLTLGCANFLSSNQGNLALESNATISRAPAGGGKRGPKGESRAERERRTERRKELDLKMKEAGKSYTEVMRGIEGKTLDLANPTDAVKFLEMKGLSELRTERDIEDIRRELEETDPAAKEGLDKLIERLVDSVIEGKNTKELVLNDALRDSIVVMNVVKVKFKDGTQEYVFIQDLPAEVQTKLENSKYIKDGASKKAIAEIVSKENKGKEISSAKKVSGATVRGELMSKLVKQLKERLKCVLGLKA